MSLNVSLSFSLFLYVSVSLYPLFLSVSRYPYVSEATAGFTLGSFAEGETRIEVRPRTLSVCLAVFSLFLDSLTLCRNLSRSLCRNLYLSVRVVLSVALCVALYFYLLYT